MEEVRVRFAPSPTGLFIISVEQEQLYLTGFLLKNIMVSWCCVLKILILNG